MRRGFFGGGGGGAAQSPPKAAQAKAAATPQPPKKTAAQAAGEKKLEVEKDFRVVPLPKDEEAIVRRAEEAVAKDRLRGAYELARRFALGTTLQAPLETAKHFYWDSVKSPKDADTDLTLLEKLLASPCVSDTGLGCEESGVRRSKKPRTANSRELALEEEAQPALGFTDRTLSGEASPRRLATLAGERLWSVYFCAPAPDASALRKRRGDEKKKQQDGPVRADEKKRRETEAHPVSKKTEEDDGGAVVPKPEEGAEEPPPKEEDVTKKDEGKDDKDPKPEEAAFSGDEEEDTTASDSDDYATARVFALRASYPCQLLVHYERGLLWYEGVDFKPRLLPEMRVDADTVAASVESGAVGAFLKESACRGMTIDTKPNFDGRQGLLDNLALDSSKALFVVANHLGLKTAPVRSAVFSIDALAGARFATFRVEQPNYDRNPHKTYGVLVLEWYENHPGKVPSFYESESCDARLVASEDWTPSKMASDASRHYLVGDEAEVASLASYLARHEPRLRTFLRRATTKHCGLSPNALWTPAPLGSVAETLLTRHADPRDYGQGTTQRRLSDDDDDFKCEEDNFFWRGEDYDDFEDDFFSEDDDAAAAAAKKTTETKKKKKKKDPLLAALGFSTTTPEEAAAKRAASAERAAAAAEGNENNNVEDESSTPSALLSDEDRTHNAFDGRLGVKGHLEDYEKEELLFRASKARELGAFAQTHAPEIYAKLPVQPKDDDKFRKFSMTKLRKTVLDMEKRAKQIRATCVVEWDRWAAATAASAAKAAEQLRAEQKAAEEQRAKEAAEAKAAAAAKQKAAEREKRNAKKKKATPPSASTNASSSRRRAAAGGTDESFSDDDEMPELVDDDESFSDDDDDDGSEDEGSLDDIPELVDDDDDDSGSSVDERRSGGRGARGRGGRAAGRGGAPTRRAPAASASSRGAARGTGGRGAARGGRAAAQSLDEIDSDSDVPPPLIDDDDDDESD